MRGGLASLHIQRVEGNICASKRNTTQSEMTEQDSSAQFSVRTERHFEQATQDTSRPCSKAGQLLG